MQTKPMLLPRQIMPAVHSLKRKRWIKEMDKYTVLLVDDEEEVIQVIMKKIDWEGLGFSVIGYANNGVRALEMVEEAQPDVCLLYTSRCV